MIRKIICQNSDLLKKSKNVPIDEIKNPEIQRLIKDMKDTLYDYSRQRPARAIAACQIGEYKNIIIVKRFRLLKLYDIYINLKIIDQYGIVECEEGCISLPNVKSLVKRPRKIRVVYYNENGELVYKVLRGVLARLIFHQYDHTNGKTIIERDLEISNDTGR